ncbi:MAG: RNA-binding S4 domain-containing protein [Arenimonas sp.]
MSTAKTGPEPAIRVDLWLWVTRFYKTRALAKHAIETGKVEIDGQPVKASRLVKINDQLHITRSNELFVITVLGISEKRGSATIAQTLYLESDESRLKREAERERRKMENAGYKAPATKPDKRARRLINALGDLDML